MVRKGKVSQMFVSLYKTKFEDFIQVDFVKSPDIAMSFITKKLTSLQNLL